ncbi:MAG: hypothetical protein COA94_01665 [Rickettsiales bacterium]|nr:MAG: hypothetical protein COA94_01665 [Rickettsiales bacterium]
MFDFQEEQCKRYKSEYGKFIKSREVESYKKLSKDIGYKSQIASLVYCGGAYKNTHATSSQGQDVPKDNPAKDIITKENSPTGNPSIDNLAPANLARNNSAKGESVFLLIPSIFNSPEILFLGDKNSFTKNLSTKNNLYLASWSQQTAIQLTMENYVNEVQKMISFLHSLGHKKINLIGHCIGGNMCLAASSLQGINQSAEQSANQDAGQIESLTLLTCPWDYSHFKKWVYLYDIMGFDTHLKGINFIPKIYIQMMFFLMFPFQFKEKLEKYFALEQAHEKQSFLQIEAWLQSGNIISKSIYAEIMQDFCRKNILQNNEWLIGGELITPEKLDIPTCIIYAKDDQIAPHSSIAPLQKRIKSSTLIETEGGHIGYLVKGCAYLQTKYNEWIVENNLR